jgi:hypothetical protein
MSFSLFLLCLAAAAALLAAWLLVRFPDVSPSRPRRALTHFGISLTLLWAVTNAVALLPPVGLLSAVTATFLLVLPVLVYAWLSAAWVLSFFRTAVES